VARKTKPGLDYFPMDVDFFNDPKVELISSEFRTKGDSILLRLMCSIYRNSYFLPWDKDQSLLFAKRVGDGITGALVDEVVQGLIRRSFFHKGVYDSFSILTSKGIQTRYIDAKERAKEVVFFKEYILIDNNVLNKWKNVVIKSINEGINPQRKEKEIKGEESKGVEPIVVPVFEPFVLKIETELPGPALEAAERNQFANTGAKNTDFIKKQWSVFISERIHDPPEKQRQYRQLSDLTSYFLNWIRNKFPKNVKQGSSQVGRVFESD
jgi:hypothetical protein